MLAQWAISQTENIVQSVIAAATIEECSRSRAANASGCSDCGGSRRGIVVGVLDHVTIRVSDPAASTAFYGAYVLDPDGNNVEIVNHNR
jgi:hypothetical protein